MRCEFEVSPGSLQHALPLGQRVQFDLCAADTFEGQISVASPALDAGLTLFGRACLSPGGLVAWALSALQASAPTAADQAWLLEGIEFGKPALLSPHDVLLTQTLVSDGPRGRQVRCFGRLANRPGGPWAEQAVVKAGRQIKLGTPGRSSLSSMQVGMEQLALSGLYEALNARGAGYGHHGVRELWHDAQRGIAVIDVSAIAQGTASRMDDKTMDACFQAVFGLLGDMECTLRVPRRIDRLIAHGTWTPRSWALIRRQGAGAGAGSKVDMTLFSQQGDLQLEMVGVQFEPAGHAAL